MPNTYLYLGKINCLYTSTNNILHRIKPHIELLFWIAALIALGFSNPAQTHFVLCPLRLMGFKWCPGCGIGHAIAFLLHGDIRSSLHAHWLGVPALAVLLYRIYSLLTRPKYTFNSQTVD